MGFKWVKSNSYAVPSRITHILATNGEAFTKGEAVKLASGRWTKALAADAVAGFAEQTIAAGTDQSLSVIEARPGDVFEVKYTGTPDAGFVIGVNTADLAADALSINSADIVGGAFAVIDITTSKTTCKVQVKNRQLS